MKAPALELPATFDEMITGATYAGPYPLSANRQHIILQFTQYHGRPPAAVLWVKPGMWIAGPLDMQLASPDSAMAQAGRPASPDSAMLQPDEMQTGGDVSSPPAAPLSPNEGTQTPGAIIAPAGPGRAELWTQPSLI